MTNIVECLTSTNSTSSANICWYNATHDYYARDAQSQLNPEHHGKDWHRNLPKTETKCSSAVGSEKLLKKQFSP